MATDLIADTGFEVAEVLPGRAVFSLGCVEYTDTDCGVYFESTQSFFVEKKGGASVVPYLGALLDLVRGDLASHTWGLQVNTVLSQQCGLQMWGFPKTVEDLDFTVQGRQASFAWRSDDETVFRYSLEAVGTGDQPASDNTVYSILEGEQHEGVLTTKLSDAKVSLGVGKLEVGTRHPMAQKLRALGLPKRPLLSVWAGHLEFTMSAPRRLG